MKIAPTGLYLAGPKRVSNAALRSFQLPGYIESNFCWRPQKRKQTSCVLGLPVLTYRTQRQHHKSDWSLLMTTYYGPAIPLAVSVWCLTLAILIGDSRRDVL